MIPQELLLLVDSHFCDIKKSEIWFYIPNPELKGMRPIDYKIGGKWDVLEKLIRKALKECNVEYNKQLSSPATT